MQNLGDMNDLYNAQDVVLLCKIAENRFQFMHDQYGFNLRQCNSAINGCIESEMSRVIIVLPTSNKAVDFFEQTITRGFRLVNTRLAFGTKTLPPNLINEEKNLKMKNFKKITTIKFVITSG